VRRGSHISQELIVVNNKKRSPLQLERLEDRTLLSYSQLGNVLQVSADSANSLSVPAIAMDAAGDSIVVWQTVHIMTRRFDPSGAPLTDEVAITTVPGDQVDPAVAMDSAGNYVVAWQSYADYSVHAQRFNAAGVAQTGDIVVAPLTSTPLNSKPAVAIVPSGFSVFWDNNDTHIHGMHYDGTGNLLGAIDVPEAQVVHLPRVAADAGGNFVAVYDSGAEFTAGRDSAGKAVGMQFSLSATAAATTFSPVVAAEPAGNFAVAYGNTGDTTGAADSGPGYYINVFNANASPRSNILRIDTTGDTSGADAAPAIAIDAAGDFAVSWLHGAQLFGPTGIPQGTVFLQNVSPTFPAISSTANRLMFVFSGSGIHADLFAAGPNHAPVLDTSTTPAFTFVAKNDANPPGDRVGDIFGPSISDQDLGPFQGIAVAGLTGASSGAWQYSLDSGATWTAIGAVSETAALLLDANDLIRFVPSSGFLGTVSLTERAWDESTGAVGANADLTAGTGGTTAFSSTEGSATLSVTPNGNYSPVLATTYMAKLTDVPVNQVTTGNTVAEIVGPSITDRNKGAVQGIAVTGLTGAANGTWQFSLNGGFSWTPIGAVSTGAALLLRAIDRVRFIPNAEFIGTPTITYHAWDQTLGVAGGSADLTNIDPVGGAFSVAQSSASVTVSRFILNGTTLDVYGTTGNDNFLYTPGGAVTLNGDTHNYPVGFSADPSFLRSLTINFHGNGGTDTASVDMRQTAVAPSNVYLWGKATITDGFATVEKQPFLIADHEAFFYQVNLFNVANIYISGGAGDIVTIDGSTSGANTYVSTPTYSYLSAPNRFNVVSGVGGNIGFSTLGAVYAYANHSPNDQAYFYGSSGLDAFVASGSAFSYMSGQGFFNVAAGFGNVQAFSDGQDIAYFLDSPYDDVFYGTSTSSYMSGPSFLNAAAGFAVIYAQSFVGGKDVAYNYAPTRIITGGFATVFS
jgi:hypothetical protein